MVKRNMFREKVLLVVKKIPKGKTMSYKEVAARAGHPGAARAVGAIMRTNTDKTVPCATASSALTAPWVGTTALGAKKKDC